MSHRAKIAIKRGGQYDMYYSHNGAHNLQLLDQLRENADALCQSQSSPGSLGMGTQNVPAVQKWGAGGQHAGDMSFESQLGEDIDSEPTFTGVPLNLVGGPIEYDNIEAFYLVEDGTVTPYVPVWLWPNAIRPIRNALEVEVYRGGRLDSDPAKLVERLEDTDPIAVITSETIGRGTNWLENPVICDILRDHHASITALWKMQLEEGVPQRHSDIAVNGEKPDPSGLLHLDNYIVLFRVLDTSVTPPPSRGLGMLVELPSNATESDREDVWFRGSKTRFNIGAGMNVMRSEPDREDITSGLADVFLELYEAFGHRISERSPPPAGIIITAMNERLDTMKGVDEPEDVPLDVGRGVVRDLLSDRDPDGLDLSES